MSHSHDVAGASEIDELCKRLEGNASSFAPLMREAAALIRRLAAERDEAREISENAVEQISVMRASLEYSEQQKLMSLNNDLLTRATAAEAEVARLRAENAELKAWKKRRQEEDEDEADRREIW